jgi:hypothetical protein
MMAYLLSDVRAQTLAERHLRAFWQVGQQPQDGNERCGKGDFQRAFFQSLANMLRCFSAGQRMGIGKSLCSVNGVSTKPGLTRVTSMFFWARSIRSDSSK